MASRKRSWMYDEVVLALQLYLREGVGSLAQARPLSEELRVWPVEGHFAADPSFRNEQSVRSKLYNLQWLATDGARGRGNAGAQTEEVWREFGADLERVDTAAAEIRKALATVDRSSAAAEDEYETDESGIRLVAHRQRERDADLPRRKRAQVKRLTGALACEACGFDSNAAWGVEGIIECHHLIPVSELEPGETTKLADVRLLCPNCHRLIHSRSKWLTWEELLAYVQ
jgi:5-methylcytosine-specific restriction protein A